MNSGHAAAGTLLNALARHRPVGPVCTELEEKPEPHSSDLKVDQEIDEEKQIVGKRFMRYIQ